jgi:hypothetical protein
MSSITKVILDRNDRKIVAVTSQDVEPILELNKARQNEVQKHDCARLIADIPCVFLVQWLNEEHARGNTQLRLFTREFNETVVKRKLQDPDWKWLRTT